MAWAKPLYSREQVNAAAKVLMETLRNLGKVDDGYDAYWHALSVINNFRSSHAYPLNTFQVGLRNNGRRFDPNTLVAQRIKRLWSIYHKLDRFKTMKLSQIQDLGGCRAILETAEQVLNVHEYYTKKSNIKHQLATVDNYIEKPRTSGYRGVHLVYRYFSDRQQTSIYNDLKIEMQLRSRYQHAWATAVETVGMFSGQALKSSLGSQEWQRFFALMGGAIALREGHPGVPNVPTNRAELRDELRACATQLNVVERLRGYRTAVQTLSKDSQDAHYFLLELDPSVGTLQITGFGAGQAQLAAERYSDAEQKIKQEPGKDAVLVSVDSIVSLARAYPNYFADTRLFSALLNQALTGRSGGIKIANRVPKTTGPS